MMPTATETKTYEVCCAGISYFEPEVKRDAGGTPIKVNGQTVTVNVRRHAGAGDMVELSENEANRLLALEAVQEPGAAPLPWQRAPKATVFSTPVRGAEDQDAPDLAHGDPRPPHEAPTHDARQAPDEVAAALGHDEDGEDDSDEEFDLETASIAEIADFIKTETPSVKDLVEAVDDEKELAEKVLEAERSATGNNPRSTLVRALTPIIEADDGEEPDESDEGES